MVDYKVRETVFSFLIPRKEELTRFISLLFNSDAIDDYEVVYSNFMKENYPDIFRDDSEFLLNDPIVNLVEVLEKIYLNKKSFDSLTRKIVKELKNKNPGVDDDYIYLNAILASINFQIQPLYNFSHKEKDKIVKLQEHFYGVTNEIELEKDENTANPIIDIYFGWIDFRAMNINNNLKKEGLNLPKESIILDIYVKSDFLALFEYVFNKFADEEGFKLLDIPLY